VSEQLADVVKSKAIGSDGSTRKRLIIMDEVDGMGGSDRGGIPELIKVIKDSKSPIVCICNDRQCQKIRSLANHCYDLRIKRPIKQTIAKRLVEIARLEGMSMDQGSAEMLVEQVGNDIRQALHAMQMWRAQSESMNYKELKEGMQRIEKDKVLRQSPFDACLQILGGNKPNAPLDDRYNSFFVDYALVPLLVQQNYIEAARGGLFKQPSLDDVAKLERLSVAADACADMELVGSSIMGMDQHWELLPAQAAFSVRVGSMCQGFMPFPTFPLWLGKNSTKGKMKRLTHEIMTHSLLSIGQGFAAVRLEYTPYLRRALLAPLLEEKEEGVHKVIALLDAYGLSREDFIESLKELQFVVKEDKVLLRDFYEDVESKVKAALTRTYNQMEHKSQALVSTQNVKKKRGGGGGGDDEEGGLTEEGREEAKAARASDDEEEKDMDVGDVSAFAKKLKKDTAAAKRKGAGGGGGKGAGKGATAGKKK